MAYDDFVKKKVLLPLGITGMKLGCSKFEGRMPGEVTYESKRGAVYGAFNLENMDSHGGWLAAMAGFGEQPDEAVLRGAVLVVEAFGGSSQGMKNALKIISRDVVGRVQ